MSKAWVEQTRSGSYDEAKLMAFKTIRMVQWFLDESHPVIKRDAVTRFKEIMPDADLNPEDMDAEADTFTRLTVAIPVVEGIEGEFRESFTAILREVAMILYKKLPADNRWKILGHLVGGLEVDSVDKDFQHFLGHTILVMKQFGFDEDDTIATAMETAHLVVDKFLDHSEVLVVGRHYKDNQYQDGDRTMMPLREFMEMVESEEEASK